jgi:hypothetical protein
MYTLAVFLYLHWRCWRLGEGMGEKEGKKIQNNGAILMAMIINNWYFTADNRENERRPSKVEIRRKSLLLLRKQISFEEKVSNQKKLMKYFAVTINRNMIGSQIG